MSVFGKILILLGILFIITGIIFYFAGDKLNWLGRLPGDIRIEKENLKIYIPIATMLLLSLIISLLAYIFKRFF
ncbi:MAG: DUF2905 domain-containing protein [Bacteroidales bacterium]|nr:DUF2905 domain-containing protein [Bacteroidales bacterium]